MRLSLPSRLSSTEFWHAQLNYACLHAEPNMAGRGYTEGLAGDQLCQWNTIVSDTIPPSTHLTLFLPPSLAAYVMANHQTHRDFKPQPSTSAETTPTFCVGQWLLSPSLKFSQTSKNSCPWPDTRLRRLHQSCLYSLFEPLPYKQ